MKISIQTAIGVLPLLIGGIYLGHYLGTPKVSLPPKEQHASQASHDAHVRSNTVISRPNTVMKIPAGRYEAIDAAEHILIQLCKSKEECAVRFEDLKAFRDTYAGIDIQFAQINLAEHKVYADMLKQAEAAKAAEAAKDAAKPVSPAMPGSAPASPGSASVLDGKVDPKTGVDPKTVVDKQTVTEIQGSTTPRGLFDTCKGDGPDAVTYLLKTGGPDLNVGIICSAAELERFISKYGEISPDQKYIQEHGAPTFSTKPFYDLALFAMRMDEESKKSMATVWLKHGGQRDGVGSGFSAGVDAAGRCEIVTANHVTDDRQATVEVTLANGHTYPATIALEKPSLELTILKVAGVENPHEACKPLKIAQDTVSADQPVFMATIPLPDYIDDKEHPEFNEIQTAALTREMLAERWTRGASDNMGLVTEVKHFSPLPKRQARYQVGQDVVILDIQGYQADSGTPDLILRDGAKEPEVIGVNFITQERGEITLAVPSRFVIEALDELHRKESAQP